MITRYLKPIKLVSATSAIDLINAITSAFVDVGFTEVIPLRSTSIIKAVRFENVEVDIYASGGNTIFLESYLHYNDGSYNSLSTFATLTTSEYKCDLCFFISDDGKFVAVNVSGGTTQMGKGSNYLFLIITDNEKIVGIKSKDDKGNYYSTNQYDVKLSLKRTYQKEENVFFLDEGVPVLKSSDNSYIMDMPYLTTLGGAEAQHTYTMTNGDNYYCLLDNIAVKFDTTVFSQTGT